MLIISAVKKIWNKSLPTRRSIIKYSKRNHLPIIEICVIVGSLWAITYQLSENVKQNRVSIRGQLYATESAFEKESRDDDILNAIYISIPTKYKGSDYGYKALRAVTKNQSALKATSAIELYEIINGSDSYTDSATREEIKDLRKVYTFSTSILYHIHNAFDYQKEGILDSIEWTTWKGWIREMSANPIFLAAIYNGYKYEYMSREFGQFLVNEITSKHPVDLKDKADSLEYFRDRAFIYKYYRPMFSKNWADKLPDYKIE